MRTLYDRLGGEDAIAAVVDDFYDRILDDEQVAHFSIASTCESNVPTRPSF